MAGWDGLTEHGMTLDFGWDPKELTRAMKDFNSFGQLLTQVADLAVKRFTEIDVGGTSLMEVLKHLQRTVVATMGRGSGGGSNQGASAAVEAFGSTATAALGDAGGAFAGLAVAATGAVADLLNALGNTAISTQELSRMLWTGQQQALAFSTALKATGASLQDLYLSPTLMNQYNALYKVAQQVLPRGWQRAAAQANDLSLAFKKMHVEATGFFMDLGIDLVRDLSGPLGGVGKALSDLNAYVIRNVPQWASDIAAFLADMARVGGVIAAVFKPVVSVVGAVGGVIAVLFGLIARSGVLDGLWKSIENLGAAFANLGNTVGSALGSLFGALNGHGAGGAAQTFLGLLAKSLEGIAIVLSFAVQQVANFVNWLARAKEPVKALVEAVVLLGGAIAAIALVSNPFAWVAVAGLAVEELASHWQEISQWVGNVTNDVIQLADAVARTLAPVLDPAISALDQVTGAKIGLIGVPVEPGSYGAQAAAAAVRSGATTLGGRESAARHAFTAHIPRVAGAMTHAQMERLLGQGNARVTNVDARQTVNISGAGNPAATGMEVTRHFNRHLRNIRGWNG